jgi:hypothetical protein
MTSMMEVLSHGDASKSESSRIAIRDRGFQLLANQRQNIIAAFLRVSDGLMSKWHMQAELGGQAGINRDRGWSALLPPHREETIREWIRSKTVTRDWHRYAPS